MGDFEEVERLQAGIRTTAVGHDGRPVRRPVARAEVCAGHPKNQWAVIGAVYDAFAGNRLVMPGADTAEITHDVVLQAWPRLRGWLAEDRASLILYGQLATESQAGVTMATGAPVAALAFSADGTTLATAETDGPTELWAFATQQQTGAALAAQGSGSASALAFSPSANALAAGDGNGTVELWNPASFHQSSAPIAIGTPESPTAAAGHPPAVLSVRGDILAVSDGGGTVRLWNVLARRPDGRQVASQHAVTGLALSPDGKTLAVAAHGLRLWSTATGRQIGRPLPAADAGGPVAFSPDGTLVAAIGTDDKARLWNVATQQETGTAVTVGPDASQGALAFSPNGKTYATVGANRDRRALERDYPAQDRRAHDRGRPGIRRRAGDGQAGLRARVQPGRRHAGHRRR